MNNRRNWRPDIKWLHTDIYGTKSGNNKSVGLKNVWLETEALSQLKI